MPETFYVVCMNLVDVGLSFGFDVLQCIGDSWFFPFLCLFLQ